MSVKKFLKYFSLLFKRAFKTIVSRGVKTIKSLCSYSVMDPIIHCICECTHPTLTSIMFSINKKKTQFQRR